MENYEPRSKSNPHHEKDLKKKKHHHKKSDFEDALDNLLNVEKLIECSERGGEEDLAIIETIIESDPRR